MSCSVQEDDDELLMPFAINAIVKFLGRQVVVLSSACLLLMRSASNCYQDVMSLDWY